MDKGGSGTAVRAGAYVQPELAEQTWARLREGGQHPVKRGEWVAPPKCLRVAVLGATGGVGQQVTHLALAAGHSVVALVREPSEMVPRRARRLHTFRFDAHSCSASELAPLLKGCDLVLSCLGNRRGEPQVVHRGTATLLEAMVAAGVPRMVMLSCVGVGDSGAQLRRTGPMGWVHSLMFATLLSGDLADLAAAEAMCLGQPRAGDVACVVVRAADLIDGEGLGSCHVAAATEPLGASVAREDVARFLLSLTREHRHDGRAVSVSQRPPVVPGPKVKHVPRADDSATLKPGPNPAADGAARPALVLLEWLQGFSRGAAAGGEQGFAAAAHAVPGLGLEVAPSHGVAGMELGHTLEEQGVQSGPGGTQPATYQCRCVPDSVAQVAQVTWVTRVTRVADTGVISIPAAGWQPPLQGAEAANRRICFDGVESSSDLAPSSGEKAISMPSSLTTKSSVHEKHQEKHQRTGALSAWI
jgi:hypothetical protein